jgi:hypothetical protein
VEIILSQFTNKVFCRTELGEAEIRQRTLALSRAEQVVLLAINGESNFAELQMEFANDSSIEFEKSIESLLQKALIKSQSYQELTNAAADFGAGSVDSASFSSEDFFSSSLDPLHSGSGLVVDTKAKSMRSVNLKKKPQESVYDVDIPLSLELDTKLRLKKEKRQSKLVQVFPNPERPKKRRRSKRPKAEPVNPWPMRIYIGLTAIGLLLVAAAILSHL